MLVVAMYQYIIWLQVYNPHQVGLSGGKLRPECVDTSLHGGEVVADIVISFAFTLLFIVVASITVVFVTSPQLGLLDLLVEANCKANLLVDFGKKGVERRLDIVLLLFGTVSSRFVALTHL